MLCDFWSRGLECEVGGVDLGGNGQGVREG